MAHVTFTLVSPDQHVLTEPADLVVLPGAEGYFGVLPNHAPLMSGLRPGLVTLHQSGTKQHIFVSDGFVHVTEESCLALVEEYIFLKDIDEAHLEREAQTVFEQIQITRTDAEREELQRQHHLMALKLKLVKEVVEKH